MLEMLSYPFIIRALVVGTLVSLCSALLGVNLVLKRYSMIGDGLSHVAFSAMAVATAMNWAPLSVAIPVVIAASYILLRLSSSGRFSTVSRTSSSLTWRDTARFVITKVSTRRGISSSIVRRNRCGRLNRFGSDAKTYRFFSRRTLFPCLSIEA